MTLIFEVDHKLGDFTLHGAFTSGRGITALFGRSGAGKTSIIRIIAGLTRPDSGRIVLDGDVLVDTASRTFVPMHKRRFGYVFQEARLFPHLSVQQNLNYGRWFAPRSSRAESFDRIVDMLGIAPLLSRAPDRLSGGEKQRVAIGRALLSAPRLLLMDEPLAALDDARKAEILPYLERLRDELDIPIVYVSHSIPEVARLASQIVVLQYGKVTAFGSPSEILNSPTLSTDRRETGALVEGIVAHHDEPHRLTSISLETAELQVPITAMPLGTRVRLHIPARDVMLATQRPIGLSALNILEGRVSAIGENIDGLVDITVDCGGTPIIARITDFSRERLELANGKPVFAIIKTVALQSP